MQGYWLKRNQIGIEGCAEILAALECNSTLTTLDLVQNDLGAEVPPTPLPLLTKLTVIQGGQDTRISFCIAQIQSFIEKTSGISTIRGFFFFNAGTYQ